MDHDVIIIGGGIGGASLARSLAADGIGVLVLEREKQFRDRVRGEQMQSWGVAESRDLGVHRILEESVGHDQPWVDFFLGSQLLHHRDLCATTPQKTPFFNFPHPPAQEVLLKAAGEAGAEIRRGAVVTQVRPGRRPEVTVEEGGRETSLRARLVVGADGRTSLARRAGGFKVEKDAPFLVIAGVLLDDMAIPEDNGYIFLNPQVSHGSYLFPQGGRRVRAYVAWPESAGTRLQGERDLPRFIEQSTRAGAPADYFTGVKAAGPLATFEAADTWVEHPYTEGVALLGDAAAACDPSWGQGISLTLRDARALRDALLGTDDWDSAGHAYARAHDRHYGVMHEVTLAMKQVFLRSGPEADALRARAFRGIAEDPTRVPDHVTSGPDLPWDEGVRRRFFGED